jgi:tripartite-type tricarboxylate transporter receptor subunit TctC
VRVIVGLAPGGPTDVFARLMAQKLGLATLGFEPVASTPQEFGAQIRAEIERWGNVIRAANIKGGG